MFGSLIAYSPYPEFDWHYTKYPIEDWFIAFSNESWKSTWDLIMLGVLDDEEYFNKLAFENWSLERKQTI